MELIERYFPDLTSEQRRQFALLGSLYATWNARINVISVSYTHLTLPTKLEV